MKALGRRMKGRLVLVSTAIGIAMAWSEALGQSTPDSVTIAVPEPSSLALFGVGLAGLIVLNRIRRRKK
jgi:PEP-CTERM motif